MWRNAWRTVTWFWSSYDALVSMGKFNFKTIIFNYHLILITIGSYGSKHFVSNLYSVWWRMFQKKGKVSNSAQHRVFKCQVPYLTLYLTYWYQDSPKKDRISILLLKCSQSCKMSKFKDVKNKVTLSYHFKRYQFKMIF